MRSLLLASVFTFVLGSCKHRQETASSNLMAPNANVSNVMNTLNLANVNAVEFKYESSKGQQNNTVIIMDFLLNVVGSSNQKTIQPSQDILNSIKGSSVYKDSIFLAFINSDRSLQSADKRSLQAGCYSFAIENESKNLIFAAPGVSIEAFFSSLSQQYMLYTVGDLCIDDSSKMSTVTFLSPLSIPIFSFSNFVSYLQNLGFSVGSKNNGLNFLPTQILEIISKRDDLSEAVFVEKGSIKQSDPLPVQAPASRSGVVSSHAVPVRPISVRATRASLDYASLSTSLHVEERRSGLLGAVRTVYFPDHTPQRLLYLGSGADVENPFLSTGARELIFVDEAAPESQIITKKVGTITGADPTMTESIAGPKGQTFSRTEFKSNEAHSPLETVQYNRVGYARYFSSEDSRKPLDVIFDKDSWLEPRDQASLLAAANSLNTGGVWISNHFNMGRTNLADQEMSYFGDLFKTAGLEDVTHSMISSHPTQYEVPFGNLGNLVVLRKTGSYDSATFDEVLSVYYSCKSAVNMTDPIHASDLRYLEEEDIQDTLKFMQTAVESKASNPQIRAQIEPLFKKLEADVLALKRQQEA